MIRNVKAPDERRAEFVATAQQLFYTKGYERTSVNDIIKAVGLSKGAFYHYFDSKQAVLSAVVDQLIDQSLGIMQQIINDSNHDAITKFRLVRQMISGWKLERKADLLSVGRILVLPENIPLYHKMRVEGERRFVPEFGKIIAQGVEEGVFETAAPLDAARFVLAVMRAASERFMELLFEPDLVADPVAVAQQNFRAGQTAIERILNVTPGSLPFIDNETVVAWFIEEE